MTESVKEEAIKTLKSVLHAFHEKRFADILSVVSESEIERPEAFLAEFIQGTLELNGFDTIDEYGVPCSFKPNYEYSQLDVYEYKDNSGFTMEYAMTSGSKLVDMVLQLEFLYTDNMEIKSIFKNVDPQ